MEAWELIVSDKSLASIAVDPIVNYPIITRRRWLLPVPYIMDNIHRELVGVLATSTNDISHAHISAAASRFSRSVMTFSKGRFRACRSVTTLNQALFCVFSNLLFW